MMDLSSIDLVSTGSSKYAPTLARLRSPSLPAARSRSRGRDEADRSARRILSLPHEVRGGKASGSEPGWGMARLESAVSQIEFARRAKYACTSCANCPSRQSAASEAIAGCPKSVALRAVPCPQKGRFAIVTSVGRGMRWTCWCRRTSDADADGEGVWFWRPLAGAKPAGSRCRP